MTTYLSDDGVPVLLLPMPAEEDRRCLATVLRYLRAKEYGPDAPPITPEVAVLFALRCTADTIREGDAP